MLKSIPQNDVIIRRYNDRYFYTDRLCPFEIKTSARIRNIYICLIAFIFIFYYLFRPQNSLTRSIDTEMHSDKKKRKEKRNIQARFFTSGLSTCFQNKESLHFDEHRQNTSQNVKDKKVHIVQVSTVTYQHANLLYCQFNA